MSAFWDSDRMTSRLATVLGRVARTLERRLAGPMVVALVAAGAWFAIAGDAQAARRLRHFDQDSVRIARKIKIDDQGIRIVRGDQVVHTETLPGGGRVRVTVDPADGDVQVDGDRADQDSEAGGDTMDFGKSRTVDIGAHGIVIDADEDAGMVRMFSDAEVPAGERIQGDVVAVFGDVLVEGQVSGNVVAVFGSVRLEPGAKIDGDAVAVGGVLDQPPGAAVGGESVSLGFLPMQWGAPSLGMMLGVVFLCWLVSLFVGWILMLLFPARMLRAAVTASRRTGGSLVLGLLSGPLLIITIVLLLVTVIGIPIAFILPLVYLISLWGGQLALTYALGCRLLHRRLGEGSMMPALVAGTLFVAAFFVLGTILGRPEGMLRTIAMFFDLLGFLLIMGLSVIGIGAFLLSRMGTRPRDVEYEPYASAPRTGGSPMAGPHHVGPVPSTEAPSAPLAPPAT